MPGARDGPVSGSHVSDPGQKETFRHSTPSRTAQYGGFDREPPKARADQGSAGTGPR